MKNIIKNRTLQFLFSLTISTLLFLFISYIVLVDNYKKIEKNQNIKNITTLINSIEKGLKSSDRAIKLLSLSKNIDLFIRDKKDYFSQELLSYLNIDLLLIQENKKLIFSKINSDLKVKNLILLENKIFETNEKKDQFTILKQIDNKLLYISKIKIKTYNIYLIQELNHEKLNTLSQNFNAIEQIPEHIYAMDSSFKLKSKSFYSIHIENTFNEKENINRISFYDKNNQYLFSLRTSDDRIIVNEAKTTIMVFTVAVILFLIIVFYITYVYQKIVNNHNENLEQKVEDRTKQIKFTIQELEKTNLKLYEIAHTDFLTKTMNRRNFFIHAQELFKKSKASKKPICVAMIDIDNFKSINDTYGHDIGDKVLRDFSSCIKEILNDKEIFGRLGGEEFAIVYENCSLNNAVVKTEKIREAIQKIRIKTNGNYLNITASFGVSDNLDCKTIDSMLQKADKYLYNAKESGKNRVRSRV